MHVCLVLQVLAHSEAELDQTNHARAGIQISQQRFGQYLVKVEAVDYTSTCQAIAHSQYNANSPAQTA